jgi:predicted nuclease with TOPRIM domain
MVTYLAKIGEWEAALASASQKEALATPVCASPVAGGNAVGCIGEEEEDHDDETDLTAWDKLFSSEKFHELMRRNSADGSDCPMSPLLGRMKRNSIVEGLGGMWRSIGTQTEEEYSAKDAKLRFRERRSILNKSMSSLETRGYVHKSGELLSKSARAAMMANFTFSTGHDKSGLAPCTCGDAKASLGADGRCGVCLGFPSDRDDGIEPASKCVCASLEPQLRSLATNIAKLRAQAAQTAAGLAEEMEGEAATASARLGEAEAARREAEARIFAGEKLSAEMRERLASSAAQTEELRRRNTELSHDIRELQERQESRQAEETSGTAAARAQAAQIKELAQRNAELDRTVRDLETQAARQAVEASSRAATSQADEMAEKLASSTAQIQELRRRNAELDQANYDLQSKLEDLERESSIRSQDLSHSIQRVFEEQRQQAWSSARLRELETENGDAKARLDEVLRQAEASTAQLVSSTARAQELERRCAELQAKVEALERVRSQSCTAAVSPHQEPEGGPAKPDEQLRDAVQRIRIFEVERTNTAFLLDDLARRYSDAAESLASGAAELERAQAMLRYEQEVSDKLR